ncbi:MAG: SDR family oxidoreductase [Candidatus Kapaibacterium sp.]
MNLSHNTILITGGGTGIGLELAGEFLSRSNKVIICGRREEKLREAKERHPELHTIQCDISRSEERISLSKNTIEKFPSLNILINNAGIQQELNFLSEIESGKIEDEISTDLTAQIHLSSLFIPHLRRKEHPAIINISSGLAFVPLSIVPVYCATKAAIHSFSMSLRKQLEKTPIKVFEIAPPTVDTNLDRGAREKRGMTDRGISAAECAAEMIKALEADTFFAPIGQGENLYGALTGGKADFVFERMNG